MGRLPAISSSDMNTISSTYSQEDITNTLQVQIPSELQWVFTHLTIIRDGTSCDAAQMTATDLDRKVADIAFKALLSKQYGPSTQSGRAEALEQEIAWLLEKKVSVEVHPQSEGGLGGIVVFPRDFQSHLNR